MNTPDKRITWKYMFVHSWPKPWLRQFSWGLEEGPVQLVVWEISSFWCFHLTPKICPLWKETPPIRKFQHLKKLT